MLMKISTDCIQIVWLGKPLLTEALCAWGSLSSEPQPWLTSCERCRGTLQTGKLIPSLFPWPSEWRTNDWSNLHTIIHDMCQNQSQKTDHKSPDVALHLILQSCYKLKAKRICNWAHEEQTQDFCKDSGKQGRDYSLESRMLSAWGSVLCRAPYQNWEDGDQDWI